MKANSQTQNLNNLIDWKHMIVVLEDKRERIQPVTLQSINQYNLRPRWRNISDSNDEIVLNLSTDGILRGTVQIDDNDYQYIC